MNKFINNNIGSRFRIEKEYNKFKIDRKIDKLLG